MKKSMIFVGILAITYANAQDYRGNVGINTEQPSATLNVKSLSGRTTAATKNLELENGAGTKLVTVLNNGNVGIGTTNPTHILQIDSNQIYPVVIKNTQHEYTTEAMNSAIIFKDKNNDNYGYIGDVSRHKRISILGTNGYQASMGSTRPDTRDQVHIIIDSESKLNRVLFETIDETGLTSSTFITDKGNWRIGGASNTPTSEKLEVNGKIKANNVIFTGIPTYANDTAAGTGGLVKGEMYKTATGELRIKL